MDNLIPIVNDLQDALTVVGSKLAFKLPQIAVVGNQSAGKSSVLENIVGKDFLPRGSGIVTRRPLILQLIRNSAEEYGEFLHRGNDKFYNFEQIRSEIEAETYRVCGREKGVSADPINLKIHSPKVLDLTLIDLPGMTKVPVGDQPEDIESQIRQLVLNYIDNPNCLILAVCPANADLATSDALKIAQEVDPDGLRTIGVLTKLDLMDQGTDAKDILDNKVVPLNYGYIGVVNRSQLDIEGNKNIDAALKSELHYFDSHPVYKYMKDKMGTQYLLNCLNCYLTQHIAQILPDFKHDLKIQKEDLEIQLKQFQTEFDYEDQFWKPKALVLFAIRFAERFRIELLGNSDFHLNFDSLSPGAKIMTIFHIKYKQMLFSTEFTQEETMKREIGYAIQNILGVRTGLFTPDKAFDLIIRSQIRKLEEPTLWVLEATYHELLEAIKHANMEAKRFPALEREIDNRANLAINVNYHKAEDQIKQLIEYEFGYINTKHEDFVGFNYAEQKAYSRILKRRNPGSQVSSKGWLMLKGRKYWFVLTPDAFTWFTDDQETERLYMIPTDENILFRDHMRDCRFTIYNPRNNNIYLDKPKIELQALNYDQLYSWKRSLVQVGIFSDQPESFGMPNEPTISEQILDTNDPWLERQIESIWILVDSYMKIICKTLLDIVPKCIVHILIKASVIHMEKQLIAEMSRLQNCDELMEENKIEMERKRELERLYRACKNALERLSKVALPKVARNKPIARPKQQQFSAEIDSYRAPNMGKWEIESRSRKQSTPVPSTISTSEAVRPPRKSKSVRTQHEIKKAINKSKDNSPSLFHVNI